MRKAKNPAEHIQAAMPPARQTHGRCPSCRRPFLPDDRTSTEIAFAGPDSPAASHIRLHDHYGETSGPPPLRDAFIAFLDHTKHTGTIPWDVLQAVIDAFASDYAPLAAVVLPCLSGEATQREMAATLGLPLSTFATYLLPRGRHVLGELYQQKLRETPP